MANTNNTNIIKYNRSINVNVGILVFFFILVELVVAVLGYVNNKHVSPYEVKTGSLYANSLYTGIALRKEDVISASDSGYVNYYVREGQHVAVGDLVYTVDETGHMLDSVDSTANAMSDSDLARLRTDISGFSANFNTYTFSEVYSFKNSLNSKAVELANYDILSSISDVSSINSSLVHFRYADRPGVVTYSVDGFEGLSMNDLTMDMFDQANYEHKQLMANALVSNGDTVYKICNDEDWMIVIPVDADTAEILMDLGYVEVKFSRNQYTSWGAVSHYIDDEGNNYIGLSFTNSMISFCMDRFVNIELLLDNESGLKIPHSSMATKDFYTVPKEYVTIGNSGKQGVLRQGIDDEGNDTVEFIETSVYSESENEYYLDNLELRSGDILQKPNSTDTYTIRLTDSLQGVYNINKGYTEFKEIIVLYENDDYYIVKPNTTYGLNEYDYIVLDASTVADHEMLYN